ncbi:MAG TPA: hypothetical protein VLA88_04955 [Candidatus Saccharimonadales bacterium]|nr:hypothetical protein [Candidatus Saccharimonadales bacterium]
MLGVYANEWGREGDSITLSVKLKKDVDAGSLASRLWGINGVRRVETLPGGVEYHEVRIVFKSRYPGSRDVRDLLYSALEGDWLEDPHGF